MSDKQFSRKEPYFMSFYKNVALLNQVYNVETKFLVQLMAKSNRDMVIHLTPCLKEEIMSTIGSDASNRAKAANKHLNSLKRKGIIASYGRGAYMINPKIHGYSNAHESIMSKNAKFIELKMKHSANGDLVDKEILVIDKETGEVLK